MPSLAWGRHGAARVRAFNIRGTGRQRRAMPAVLGALSKLAQGVEKTEAGAGIEARVAVAASKLWGAGCTGDGALSW
jgi:hypothetical protein